jgi:hypothetical protein
MTEYRVEKELNESAGRWGFPALSRGLCIIGILSFWLACGDPTPSTVSEVARVGQHEMHIAVPAGWSQERAEVKLRLQNGEHWIEFRDMGPASPDALLAEVRQGRALYRAGHFNQSREHVAGVDLRRSFVSERRWSKIGRYFQRIKGVDDVRSFDKGRVNRAHDKIEAELEATRFIDLKSWVTHEFQRLDTGGQLETLSLEEAEVEGRNAVLVESRVRGADGPRLFHAFCLNRGRLLGAEASPGWSAPASDLFRGLRFGGET